MLTQADAKSSCITCHADKPEQIEKAKVQHPGAMGDCTDCHNPHAVRLPGFPKLDAVNVCLGFGQGCTTCHEPHGGDNLQVLSRRARNMTLY